MSTTQVPYLGLPPSRRGLAGDARASSPSADGVLRVRAARPQRQSLALSLIRLGSAGSLQPSSTPFAGGGGLGRGPWEGLPPRR